MTRDAGYELIIRIVEGLEGCNSGRMQLSAK
jgi:hypothetical protein